LVDSAKLAALTDPQRECLRVYFVKQNSKAVANALNISVEAVKDRLERARRTLEVDYSSEAAYALALAEGRVTPSLGGWPPSAGLAGITRFPQEVSLPKPDAPAVTMVRENQSTGLLRRADASTGERPNDDHNNLSDRLSSVSGQILKSAQVIALILVLAWITMVAINSLRPGFFRFLDTLHI
jgi:hypothetical protein